MSVSTVEKRNESYKFSCVIAQETTPKGKVVMIDMRKRQPE